MERGDDLYGQAVVSRNWCRLHEITLDSDDQSFVEETVSQHKGILIGIRRQLQMLKPELQRTVKGLLDGEEIDLDQAVDSIVYLKAGHSANDKIHVQRLKKERDVAARESEIQVKDEDDFLETFYGPDSQLQDAPRRRIIDVEKESVVLMAEALEELGDSYAVCGFSGYGKDLVDYYLCKDFDYGKDRNLREYGIQDTTKALSEARHKGVQTFCLTVDPPVTTT